MPVIERDNGWLFFIQECQGCGEDWPAMLIACTEQGLHCADCAPAELPIVRRRSFPIGDYRPICRACNRAGLRESEMGWIDGRGYCPTCWPEAIWELRQSMRMVREMPIGVREK